MTRSHPIRKAWDIDRFKRPSVVINGQCEHGMCDWCPHGCFDDRIVAMSQSDFESLQKALDEKIMSLGYEIDDWIYEDELPKNISQQEYDRWFSQSKIILGVRMGPKNGYLIDKVEKI